MIFSDRAKKITASLTSLLLSGAAFAMQEATGKIDVFYADPAGAAAVSFAGGFPANLSAECPSATGGFAGVPSTADPLVKSTLLAAKTANANVKLVIVGCEAGGGWFKIAQVYILP